MPPRPPRVLHVIDSLQLGGAESLFAALVRELRRSGRSWNAVCVPETEDADPGLVDRVREHADEFRWLHPCSLYNPSIYRSLGAALLKFRAEVVHSHLSTANIASRAVALPLRRPHMATIHTVPGPAAEETRLRAFVDGWSAWLSRRLVAPSQEVADAYRTAYRLPAARLRVIRNAPAARAPGEGFNRDAVRSEVGGERVEHLVLAVARLQPAKGIDDLIAAAASLRDRIPGLRVAVAGSGPEEATLRAHLERAELKSSFVLLGARSDVGELLAAADAFCLPSRHEGLPISLLEAMQAGLPCVATSVGGIPGVISDGIDGVLVDPADPEALAHGLERVLRDAEAAKSMGARARDLIRDRYSIGVAVGAYAEVYGELTGRRPSRVKEIGVAG